MSAVEKIEELGSSFELMKKENGILFWYAHELSVFLEYPDFASFKFAVRMARAAADQAGFDSDKDFIPVTINDLETYKLTRFACLLCVMFADDKNEKVLQLKVSLSQYQDYVLNNYDIERIQEREKLTHGEKYMTTTAIAHGLSGEKIAKFKDDGYRGMYNMGVTELHTHKGVKSSRNLYNVMGITELAANTFRTTQTAERIKNKNLHSSEQMRMAAHEVGREVREIVIANTGVKPESIPIEQNIDDVKKNLKNIRKDILKMDSPTRKRKNTEI